MELRASLEERYPDHAADYGEEGQYHEVPLGERLPEYLVLAPEAVQGRNAGYRECACREGYRSRLQVVVEPAHLLHVLLAGHGVYDAAGAEEEQALEEGVSHKVEDPGHVRAEPDRREHKPELAYGRVREHLLYVVLHKAYRGREKGREYAD